LLVAQAGTVDPPPAEPPLPSEAVPPAAEAEVAEPPDPASEVVPEAGAGEEVADEEADDDAGEDVEDDAELPEGPHAANASPVAASRTAAAPVRAVVMRMVVLFSKCVVWRPWGSLSSCPGTTGLSSGVTRQGQNRRGRGTIVSPRVPADRVLSQTTTQREPAARMPRRRLVTLGEDRQCQWGLPDSMTQWMERPEASVVYLPRSASRQNWPAL